MVIKKLTGYILVLLACAATSYGQSGSTIYGRVTDDKGVAVEDGIVALFRQSDSGFVTYSTISGGTFTLSTLAGTAYFIKLTGLDYEDKFVTVPTHLQDTLRITLAQKANALGAVQVTGYKNALSYHNGNIKATIDNTVLAAQPGAIEVLSKLPLVQVSNDRESIGVVGKGEPLIYVGNQRITLSELSAIPVSDIKTIEIINNPPAKYEAEGRAVILVTRKTNTREGSKTDISETASQKRYLENRSSINTSLKLHSTEWKAGVQHNYARRFEGLRGVLNSDIYDYRSDFDGASIGPRHQYLLSAGMYRQLGDEDYFSLSVNGRIQHEQYDINTVSNSQQASQATHAVTQTTNSNSRPFVNASINYQKTLKKINTSLFAGGQYSRYTINVINAIDNDFNYTSQLPSERRRQDFAVDVAVARLDAKKTFANNMVWESGVNMNVSRSSSQFNISYVQQGTSLATDYSYDENIAAAYTQLSGTWHKAEYSAGLRAEYTLAQGGYTDSSQLLIDRKFAYLFPRATLSIPIDTFHTLSLNYARTVRRPNYSNANQVSNYITPFLERTNSVDILPSITDELTLNWQYRKYSLGISAYRILNSAWYVTQYDSLLQKVRMINTNFDLATGGSLTLTIPVEYGIYIGNHVASSTISYVQDPRAVQLKSLPYAYFYSSNQFRLPKGYSFTLAGWIVTRQIEGIFERQQQYAVDLSLTKTFARKLTVTLGAYDIFRSLNFVEAYNVSGIYSSTTYLENVREYAINLRYSFGGIRNARFKTREVNENSNRLN